MATLFFVVTAMGYAVTRSGIEVRWVVPLEVDEEVLIGLVCLVASSLAVVVTLTVTLLQTLGVHSPDRYLAGAALGAIHAAWSSRLAWRVHPRHTAAVTERRRRRASRRRRRRR